MQKERERKKNKLNNIFILDWFKIMECVDLCILHCIRLFIHFVHMQIQCERIAWHSSGFVHQIAYWTLIKFKVTSKRMDFEEIEMSYQKHLHIKSNQIFVYTIAQKCKAIAIIGIILCGIVFTRIYKTKLYYRKQKFLMPCLFYWFSIAFFVLRWIEAEKSVIRNWCNVGWTIEEEEEERGIYKTNKVKKNAKETEKCCVTWYWSV